MEDDTTDVEIEVRENGIPAESWTEPRRVMRWCRREEAEPIDESSAIRPGDVVVVPAKAGDRSDLGDLIVVAATEVNTDEDRAAYAEALKEVLG